MKRARAIVGTTNPAPNHVPRAATRAHNGAQSLTSSDQWLLLGVAFSIGVIPGGRTPLTPPETPVTPRKEMASWTGTPALASAVFVEMTYETPRTDGQT